MQYIFQDTDVFDDDIDEKFNKIILTDKEYFNKEEVYLLEVNFNKDMLCNINVEEINVQGIGMKDRVSNLLSFQLKKLKKICEKNGIEISSTKIQGNLIEADNIIKIEFKKDTSEPYFNGRGKNKDRIKVSLIIPNLQYVQETTKEFASESLVNIYSKLMS